MKYLYAFICTLLSFIVGAGLTRYLTCHPLHMSFYLFLTCLFGFVLVLFLYLCHRKRYIFRITVILSLIFLVVGYISIFQFIMNTPEQRSIPPLTRTKSNPGLGHTAVVLLAHGEPETYDAGPWIKQMKEFDEQHVSFVPYPFRPFFFYELREKYLEAGKSGHNLESFQIMKLIEAEYRAKGDMDTKFYISYLENEPRPDSAVIRALNDGVSKIIVCNLFITISDHTQEGIDLIKPLKLEDYGVAIEYTKPLYDSKTLQRLYVTRMNSIVPPKDREKTGIILVGHGQPVEWDRQFPTETQQETSFIADILRQLELKGYKADNLKLAWMSFRDPSVDTAVRQLVKNGVNRIYYFSTIIGSESIHAKYDVPKSIKEIKVPDNVTLQQLSAFGDKTGIVKALIERIEDAKAVK